MLVSYRWLQNYVDLTGVTAKELAEKITRSGIEVETVESVISDTTGIKVGYVVERIPHPGADKLSICKVDVGEEELLQIVCGAKNVDSGQKVAVATVGAVLPGNFKIKKAKLRGELSQGMICSLQELGFEGKVISKDYSEGIYNFPKEVEVGTDALEALNGYDEILELGLTPNRSDCLSMLGVAYEVAAILGKEVKFPEANVTSSTENSKEYISVTVEDKKANPLYMAQVVKNVKIGTSPQWLQNRLMNAGIRPINNVVDITNFVLLEYGQPLHAFDYDQLGSKEIKVRRATEGEEMVTLDGVKRTLKSDYLVITNGETPVALAGVMGGANSEVTNETTTVLVESAYFASDVVRQASKELGLRSESSARFEKGIDPLRTPLALKRAVALLEELAGGEVVSEPVVSEGELPTPTIITITAERVNGVLGTTISVEEMKSILEKLQFDVATVGNTLTITVPTRRGDITIEEDIVEEIGRLYGFDNLPLTLPVTPSTPGKLTHEQSMRRTIRRYLEGAGLYQTVTYSLTSQEKVNDFVVPENKVKAIPLAMPMSEERALLRLSLLPHLLEVVSYNQNRKVEDVSIFEMSSVFVPVENELLPSERPRLSGAISGVVFEHNWQGEKKVVDFYTVKGIVEGLLSYIGINEKITFERASIEDMHPGRTAALKLGETAIGFIGQVHPEKAKVLDIKETYVFDLDLGALTTLTEALEEMKYTSIPRFPSMTRDIAFVVDRSVTAGEIEKTIWENGGKLLKDVKLFDLYQGDKIESDKKSLAFSMKYFDPERTLTDEEVTKTHESILKAVQETTGAIVRG